MPFTVCMSDRHLLIDPPKLAGYPLQGWELIDLPLHASNEGSLRPRVARAQKIISLHPLLYLGVKRERIQTEVNE